MQTILLTSVTPYAGKNVVALGLARHFMDRGRKVGYFKPIGPLATTVDGRLTDEDAVFFKQALGLEEPLDTLAPVVLNETMIGQMLHGEAKVRDRVRAAFKTVAQGKDLVIAVSMGRMSSGLGVGYPMSEFAADVKAKVIVVDRFQWPGEVVDGILYMRALLGNSLIGAVLNRLPLGRLQRIKEQMLPFLEANGIPLFGTLPEDKALSAAPVSELVKALNGTVLCCENKLDQLVENISIGAMNIDAALRIFQRVPNKAVITGGDRADIQLAALETSTCCILLTGDMYPNERIVAHAEERGVPMVVVAGDTKAAVDECDKLFGSLSLRVGRKAERVRELAEKSFDWAAIEAKLA